MAEITEEATQEEILVNVIDRLNIHAAKHKDSAELTQTLKAQVSQVEEQLKELKARRNMLGATVPGTQFTNELLAKIFEEKQSELKEQSEAPEGLARWEIKKKDAGIMTASNNLTGSVVASYATTPAVRGRQQVNIRDLISVIPSATGLWKFYREDTPAGEGSMGFQTTHGATKAQLDYDLTEITVTVDYLAGFVRIAKQMLQDLPFMQTYVANALVEDYNRKETQAFLGQIYSAATGTPGTSSVTAEKIIQTIANMEDADCNVNGVLVTPQVWAKLLLTKPQDYSLPGGNAITVSNNGDIMIAGVPIIKVNSRNIGNDKMLIGDWSKAVIVQTEGLSVRFYEQDSDNVQKNLITGKVEARVACGILRPDHFCYTSAGTT